MRLLNKQKQEDPQYDLGLKEPFFNRFHRIRARASRFFAILETKRFYKSSAVWMLIILLFLLNLLIFNYFNYFMPKLPSEIPLLKNSMDLSRRLVQKDSISYLPHVIALSTFTGILLSNRVYNKKQYLSLIVLMVEVLSLTVLLYNLVAITSKYL